VYSFLKSFPDFLRNPIKKYDNSHNLKFLYTHVFFVCFALTIGYLILFTYGIEPVLELVNQGFSKATETNKLGKIEISKLILLLPAAALTEELIFRLVFTRQKIWFMIGFSLLLTISFGLFFDLSYNSEVRDLSNPAMLRFLVAIGFLITAISIIKPLLLRKFINIVHSNLTWLIVFSSVVFGLVHITNYEFYKITPIILWFPMVFSQFLFGFVFIWVRINYSFIQSVIFHFSSNLILVLISLLQVSTTSISDSLLMKIVFIVYLTLIMTYSLFVLIKDLYLPKYKQRATN
jgi:hypothetical protein